MQALRAHMPAISVLPTVPVNTGKTQDEVAHFTTCEGPLGSSTTGVSHAPFSCVLLVLS